MSTGRPSTSLPFPLEPTPTTYRFKEPWTATLADNVRALGIQMVCAGGSGAIAKTAVAPLERVKILLQVQAVNTPPSAQYRGLWDGLRRIPQQEGGWRALYRGNGANVLRLIPEVGFKFAVHDQFRVMFSPPDGSPLGVAEKVAAGAATGVLRTLLFYPLDLCRTRLTADTSPGGVPRPYTTIRGCLRDAWQKEGLLSWYKGLGLSLPGVVVYTSVSFTGYDWLKGQLPTDKASKDSWWYPWAKIGCGAAAGVAAQTISYPLDTLRRRLQVNHNTRFMQRPKLLNALVDLRTRTTSRVTSSSSNSSSSSSSSSIGSGGASHPAGATAAAAAAAGAGSSAGSMASSSSSSSSSAASSKAPPFKGYIGCLQHMYKTEGALIRPLFRGLWVNCCKTVPGAALQFVAYDLLKVGVTYVDPASGAMSPL